MVNKKIFLISIICTVAILLIPLIAMNFTNDVSWELIDFCIGAILLFTVSTLTQLLVKQINKTKFKVLIFLLLIILLVLFWVELAVGIFGTIFAGD